MNLLHAAIAFTIGTLAVARATRLVTSDAYPPAEALRRWWFNQTVAKRDWRRGWAPVMTDEQGMHGCPFCFAPYAAAVDLAWCLWSGATGDPAVMSWGGWWWLLNCWAAVSYLAAMVVVRDEPPE